MVVGLSRLEAGTDLSRLAGRGGCCGENRIVWTFEFKVVSDGHLAGDREMRML
jgi:hypothetical protein